MVAEPQPIAPNDPVAEVAVLGSMCASVTTAEEVMALVRPEDFYLPAHRRLFVALLSLRLDGETPTFVTVRDYLRAHPDMTVVTDDLIEAALTDTTVIGNRRTAQIVTDCAARRAVMAAADDALRFARDPAVPLSTAEEAAQRAAEAAVVGTGTEAPGPGIDTWLAEKDPEPDWLVPGFIEREDRVALTGWLEKGGKTTLLRVLAVQAAAGYLWFSPSRDIRPLRVLFVDCENPEGISRRWWARLRALVNLDDENRLVVKLRPDGIDLAGQTGDRRWLLGLCEANRPDVLFIGPMYKLHAGDPFDEREMKSLAQFLDLVRTRFRCALLMEAHTPNEPQQGKPRALRPYGASIWRRWFDFGLGLRGTDNSRTFELVQWAARDERDWPDLIERDERPSEWSWKSDYGGML